jgi:hypothetical protein
MTMKTPIQCRHDDYGGDGSIEVHYPHQKGQSAPASPQLTRQFSGIGQLKSNIPPTPTITVTSRVSSPELQQTDTACKRSNTDLIMSSHAGERDREIEEGAMALSSEEGEEKDMTENHGTDCDWLSASLSFEDDGHDPDLPARLPCRPASLTSLLLRASSSIHVGGEEDESVTSTAYFDPSDLNPSNWIQAMNMMDYAHFGFAAIALATAITHPILFVAGALTAFGTATAAEACYSRFRDGRWLFCWGSSRESNSAAVVENEHDEQAETDAPSAESKESGQPEGSEATSMSLKENQSKSRHVLMHENEQVPDKVWLEHHYPKLSTVLMEREEFGGLNCIEFFKVFFADQAPYNFLEVQKKRGDCDISYGEWEDLPLRQSLSLHPSSTSQEFPTDFEPESYQSRLIRFKAKTNSFLGPPYAATSKQQRMLIVSKRLAVLESLTTLGDIPFCDRFCVVERWLIEAEKINNRYTSSVTSFCDVIFTKSCPFEAQIRSKSCSSLMDVAHAWSLMAKQALQLAEKAKVDRLRTSADEDADMMSLRNMYESENEEKKQEDEPECLEEGVEVEHGDLIISISRSECEPSTPVGRRLSRFRRSFGSFSRPRRNASFDCLRVEGARKANDLAL